MNEGFPIIIPARFESKRFPGKPLVRIAGRELLGHVMDRCREAFPNHPWIVVATDSDRIREFVSKEKGVQCVDTPSHCPNGSHRVWEAVQALKLKGQSWSAILHIQGDEPLVPASVLQRLGQLVMKAGTSLCSFVAPLENEKALTDVNQVKVALGGHGKALYFSRSPVPHGAPIHYGHLGIYGWKTWALEKYVQHPPTLLEKSEGLEQLRWLELGESIDVEVALSLPLSVNVPEDIASVEKSLLQTSRGRSTRAPNLEGIR